MMSDFAPEQVLFDLTKKQVKVKLLTNTHRRTVYVQSERTPHTAAQKHNEENRQTV